MWHRQKAEEANGKREKPKQLGVLSLHRLAPSPIRAIRALDEVLDGAAASESL